MTCPSCFDIKEYIAGQRCPKCGWLDEDNQLGLDLPIGTVLRDKYRIGRRLAQGGFGITYLAWDTALGIRVAIKEYFPSQLGIRIQGDQTVAPLSSKSDDYQYGLGKFIDEAQTLAQFRDYPGIVSIHDFFHENSTGYMVMEFLDGCTLEAYLRANQNRMLPEMAINAITPVMDALQVVHAKKIIHRDISPENIFILADTRVKLLDFGAARRAIGERNRALSVILRDGYAPFEQYQTNGRQGPWTDVYAVAATLYRMISGRMPPSATDRLTDDPIELPSQLGAPISQPLEAVLMKGLAVDVAQRYPDMKVFGRELRAAIPLPADIETSKPVPPPPQAHGVRLGLMAAGVAIAAAGAFLWSRPVPPPVPPVPAPMVEPANPGQQAIPAPPEQKASEPARPDPPADIVLKRGTGGRKQAKCDAQVLATPFPDSAVLGKLKCDEDVAVLGEVRGAKRYQITWNNQKAYAAFSAFQALPPPPAPSGSSGAGEGNPSSLAASQPGPAPSAPPSRDCGISSGGLNGRDLSGCSLVNANFQNTRLVGTKFVGADLTGADFTGAELTKVNLSGAKLRGAKLTGVIIRDCTAMNTEFSGAELQGFRLLDCVAQGANFAGSNLTGARFSGSKLQKANFAAANVQDVYWVRANTTMADMRGVKNLSEEGLKLAYACDTTLHDPPIRGWCAALGEYVDTVVEIVAEPVIQVIDSMRKDSRPP